MSKSRKAKSIQERRRQRQLQELKQKAKSVEVEEVEDSEEELADEDAEDEVLDEEDAEEEIQKDMYSGDNPMPMMGPTTWEEKDAMEMAAEQAHEVREISWSVSDLVSNILCHPEMSVSEKASAIKNVGAGFEERVATVLSEPVEKDLDILEIESVLAHDRRTTGLIEGWIDKAVLTASARKKLDSSDFALPSKRKYPIHDRAHVRNALSRAAQQMKAGGEGAADAKAAMPKIRAAAKKFGIGMSMKKDRNAIVIEKDAKGDWRWVGWVTNNFKDTDEDILCKESHQEYVSFLDSNPHMAPTFITWHTPETARQNLPDFWTYENGFLVMSGKLTEKEAQNLLEASVATDLGMSHGTLVLSRDPKDPRVITKYRMYEVSDLPLENAANPFTALETLSKEANMDKLAYLAQFIGKDRAKELIEDKTAEAQQALQNAGVESKEKKEEAPAEAPKQETPPAPDTEAIVKELMTKLDIEGLNAFVTKAQEAIDKVPLLETAITELKKENETLTKDQDEKLAEMIAPPAFAWSVKKEMRASEAKETVVKTGDALLDAKPEVPWLSVATGTKPIPADTK